MQDKMKAAGKYGGDSGKPSTGKKPSPKAEVKPIIKKGSVGVKVTKKF